jgi:hypothetical protein
MKRINFFKTHKMSVLSMLLVVAAVLLGADPGFAMAVDPVDLAGNANPSTNLDTYDASTNPGGRPADETLQTDEQGGKTQLQGKAATGTDVTDAGLEAEDYDDRVDNFKKFAFPIETYVARRCRPQKVNSYIHKHYRTGSTDLVATYTGSSFNIVAGQNTSTTYIASTRILTLSVSDFENPECLLEYSTVAVRGVEGFKKDDSGNEISDGEMILYVLDHKDTNDKVKFYVVNAPFNTTGSATTVTFAANTELYVMGTACSESQMRVAPETYLPEGFDQYLQKKIETVVITDYFDEQTKKVSHKTQQVLDNAAYNFKRKCARSHWNGTMAAKDIIVPETGRERVYMENGLLRQVNMLYTHGSEFTDDDLLALTTLMFTDNSASEKATAFCGKKAMKRFIQLVNSAQKYKEVSKVTVNDYGIRVRKYEDNFGEIEFVWDRTLDDLGYEEYMVILDLSNATRYYMRNDQKTTRDMSKTGEAREAKEHNLCRIDCVALNGFNSIIACPSSMAIAAKNTGGIQAEFHSVSALPTGSALDATAKSYRYYLTADDETSGFNKGDVVEWDTDLDGWVEFEGLIRA